MGSGYMQYIEPNKSCGKQKMHESNAVSKLTEVWFQLQGIENGSACCRIAKISPLAYSFVIDSMIEYDDIFYQTSRPSTCLHLAAKLEVISNL